MGSCRLGSAVVLTIGALASGCAPPPETGEAGPSSARRGLGTLPELLLQRESAVKLARAERIRGGFFAQGRLFFWTDFDTWVVDSSRHRACRRPLPGVVGGGGVSERPLFLDGVSRAVIEVRARGCVAISAIVPTQVRSAAATRSGWIVITEQDSTSGFSLRFWPHGRPEAIRTLPVPLGLEPGRRPWLSIASAQNGAILGNALWPFQWVRLDDAGRTDFRSSDQGASLDPNLVMRSPEDTIPNWVALLPVRLDIAYLRQLAHVRAESRLTQLFDTMGALQRARPTSTSLGFFAADRTANRLAGVATLGGEQSLIFYSWRWVRPPVVPLEGSLPREDSNCSPV